MHFIFWFIDDVLAHGDCLPMPISNAFESSFGHGAFLAALIVYLSLVDLKSCYAWASNQRQCNFVSFRIHWS